MSTIAYHPTFDRTVPRRSAAAPTRLTRRGRLVVTTLFLVLAFALSVAYGSRSAASGEGGEPIPTTRVVVGEGDTLWEVAAGVAEPGQTRSMMRRIMELNALSTATLQNGQVLDVPAG